MTYPSGDSEPDRKEFQESQRWAAAQAARIAHARHEMLTGGLIAVAGIVAFVVMYYLALSSPGGGHYLVAGGAILYGGYRFFRGLATYWW